MGRIHVGTSGYVYAHWRNVLYPPGLKAAAWLPWYARVFDTVELNAPFYRLPTVSACDGWYASSPRDFLFAVKGSRFLTHMKRLTEVGEGLHRYFEPVLRLKEKLGPVLWQLPPQMTKPDPDRLDCFLSHLPLGVRSVVEFRCESWYREDICDVLDSHGAAFCEHDFIPRPPPRFTGGFRYLRFHGGAFTRYHGRYGREALRPFAEELQEWTRGRRESFVYFNNDLGGHAIRDALEMLELLERPSHMAPELPVSAH